MIQTTNGAYYTLGADGNYYPAGMSGYATQPYYGTTGVYGSSSYYPAGVYPAGYPGSYYGPGVIPAGGTPPLTMPAAAPATTKSLRAKEVLGTKIMIQNNTQVGTVEDIVFDDAGNMDYLIVSTDDKKLVTVPWDAAKFDGEKKTATVDITQDGWKALPTYTTTTYPQFYTSAYRTDIYKAYGLTPRVLRPIERRVP
jgi:sporulation protein YlmC with PRC-barrel domain